MILNLFETVFSCLQKNLTYAYNMIQSASRQYCVSPGALSRVLFAIVVFATLKLSLFGQETIDYRGVWQAKTPDQGRLILILKRNSLASYFWADNADQTVYQGSWSSDDEGAHLLWNDGSSHRITPNLLGYEITYSDALQETRYKTAVDKLPGDVLGQWAKGPQRPEDENSDRDRAKGFFGTWEINTDATPYYLVIEPDRSAATSFRTPADSDNAVGLRGSWAKQGSELHIAWDTGHYGILKENERNFTFRLIAPGDAIEESEASEQVATRIVNDRLPTEWKAVYDAEKQTRAGGVAFASRKDATLFYRGSWVVQLAENTFERIEIGRFGGLKTSKDSTLYGNWRMSGQDIFMNWDDGLRKILSPVGNGFLLYEYKPGRPIDGVPTRIFSATPEDVEKLAKHMEGRKAVAQRLLSLAEEAGVTSNVAATGWGQTFMRWVWPFSDTDEDDKPSDTLLQPDVESSGKADPWWWPFWSETRASEEIDSEAQRNRIKIAVDSNQAETGAGTTENETKTAKPKKSDWEWPF